MTVGEDATDATDAIGTRANSRRGLAALRCQREGATAARPPRLDRDQAGGGRTVPRVPGASSGSSGACLDGVGAAGCWRRRGEGGWVSPGVTHAQRIPAAHQSDGRSPISARGVEPPGAERPLLASRREMSAASRVRKARQTASMSKSTGLCASYENVQLRCRY